MSQIENLHEAQRWLSTAYEDYETAQYLLKGDKFAFSCFCCQQAGEKAIKAIWYYFDLEPWGHSVYETDKRIS
jgi:HEPN domain-containing protein